MVIYEQWLYATRFTTATRPLMWVPIANIYYDDVEITYYDDVEVNW